MKRGDELEVTVEKFAAEGNSVAHVDGFVVFVRGGVPGDTVRVRIVKAKRSFAEAEAVELIHPSHLRTSPRCRYFGVCGGCSWQHVSYDAQLAFKRQVVADALERIGGCSHVSVAATMGAADPYFYRNKMEFSFGIRWLTPVSFAAMKTSGQTMGEKERFALGLHVPLRFDRVLDIEECWLQSETSMRIVNAVREWSLRHGLSVYSTATHTGYLRNLVIREGKKTGDLMVNLVTSTYESPLLMSLEDELRPLFPGVTTIVNNVTTRKSLVAIGDHEYVQFGPGTIRETLGGRTYHVSANSFFQTNTLQAERLYDIVRRLAACDRNSVVFDLYSGTGTIAMHLANDAGYVVGIEAVDDAVHDAVRNAADNGITNCTFVKGDLKDTLVQDNAWLARQPQPDVMVIDPPRAGMHEKVIHRILQMRPARIVYVSCNPATQARDIALLLAGGAYGLDEVHPVDMFPHTSHVENVIRLLHRARSS